MKKRLMLLICAASFSLNSFGQSDSLTETNLADLSLEDLMNINVTTASKNEESIQSAPAIMSVVTNQEIQGFGAITLAEVLDRLTSTYMTGTYFAPDGMLAVRGKQTEHYNTNVLILMDGRPMRESLNGGYNGVIYNMFPVNQIERIEYIRGPGSVLYGTNAYVAVINIITKSAKQNESSASVRYGTFNTVQAQANFNKQFKDLQINAGVNSLYSDGWDFTARGEKDVIRNKANTADSIFKNPNTIKRDDKGLAGTIKLGYKGLTLNTFMAINDWATMNRTADWPTPLEYRIRNNRMMADLGYTKEINKIWTLSLNSTYNGFSYTAYSPSQTDDQLRRYSNDLLFEFTNFIKPSEKLNIVIGGLTNMQSGKAVQPTLNSKGKAFNIDTILNPSPWVTVPAYDYTWNSAYAQADYHPFKFLKLIAGGQVNKIPGSKTDLVPRLGAIVSITKNLGIKLLYGQAFRAPTAFERASYSPGSVYGSPLLTPEKITTYEAQINYTTSRIDLSANYFYNYDHNRIGRVNVKDTILFSGNKVAFTQKYVNSGYINTQGVEFEGKAKINDIFKVYASSTYLSSIDDQNRKDYDGMPKFMLKAGLLINYKNIVNVGIFNSYFGKGGNIFLYNSAGVLLTKMANPEAKPYNTLSANITVNLKKIIAKLPDMSLQVYGTNLLNEKIFYPEVVRRNINSIPGRPGRMIYVGVNYKF